MSAVVPELRTPVMTLVEASWEDPNGISQTVTARMEDKSAGGACIRLKAPVRVGSKLNIQWRFDRFSGDCSIPNGPYPDIGRTNVP